MAFSTEWDVAYKSGAHKSIWPWSDVVSLTNRYFQKDISKSRVLELGCGAGANIPFFVNSGCEYCGIDGSITEVELLCQKFTNEKVCIKCSDFTNNIPFEGNFDLVIDRSSVTHNNENDIRHLIDLVYDKMSPGGIYIGVDWFSLNYYHYNTDEDDYEQIDLYTRVFKNGKFKGLGNVHFSDGDHIMDLFSKFEIITLYEKIEKYAMPKQLTLGHWNFVARK